MKRRSWPMVLPHIGAFPFGTHRRMKASSASSASASVTVDALTRSIRPERPCVPLFHASILSSVSSLWWMANTGPSASMFRCISVTTKATSMMRSVSGSRPVISMSSQTRFISLGRWGAGGFADPSAISVACDIILSWRSPSNPPFSHRHSMYSLAFSILFVSFLVLTLIVRFWLASRHIRHVLRHRAAVPAEFAEKIPLAAHQKAADYTVAKTKLGMLTLLVGLQWLSVEIFRHTGAGMTYQIALIVGFTLISGVIDLPFDYYKQFGMEQHFGFNKMTRTLFFTDMVKSGAVGAAIGLPLVWVVLTLMGKAGGLWWLYAWLVLSAFQLLMMVLAPTLIMPLFNKFTPLADETLKSRIEGLMQRVGFASKGLFVMDGSKRSAHGNAYFSGFGANKRIVFFDTLLSRLAPQEIEAVLAHELGHFKLKHIVKRIAMMFLISLGFLALLGYLKTQPWFYAGLGVNPVALTLSGQGQGTDALALLLFMLVLPVFTFLLGPLSSLSSRKHEFEADAFAATHTQADDLVSALVKMYEDNASTLTPDPLHSAFYDSHPPASVRIRHLKGATA